MSFRLPAKDARDGALFHATRISFPGFQGTCRLWQASPFRRHQGAPQRMPFRRPSHARIAPASASRPDGGSGRASTSVATSSSRNGQGSSTTLPARSGCAAAAMARIAPERSGASRRCGSGRAPHSTSESVSANAISPVSRFSAASSRPSAPAHCAHPCRSSVVEQHGRPTRASSGGRTARVRPDPCSQHRTAARAAAAPSRAAGAAPRRPTGHAPNRRAGPAARRPGPPG